MLNFLDVNVLLALLWDRHVHSELVTLEDVVLAGRH